MDDDRLVLRVSREKSSGGVAQQRAPNMAGGGGPVWARAGASADTTSRPALMFTNPFPLYPPAVSKGCVAARPENRFGFFEFRASAITTTF